MEEAPKESIDTNKVTAPTTQIVEIKPTEPAKPTVPKTKKELEAEKKAEAARVKIEAEA